MCVASVIQHSADLILKGEDRCCVVITPIPRKSVYIHNLIIEKGGGAVGQTHRSGLWEGLHKLHPLGVDLDQGQQVPGLHRLTQVHHLGQG